MKIPRNVFVPLMELLLSGNVKSAVKIFDNDTIVRATHRLYNGKMLSKRSEILITIGKPNYEERIFIKSRLKNGDKFPLKGFYIKWIKKGVK